MWKDDGYLLDMLLAARKIVKFTQSFTEEAFRNDEIMHLAVVRLIQTIGEASRKISQETRDAHPKIPWAQIVGMRHQLVHEYFRVRLDLVWNVVREDIPKLIEQIAPLVPPPESEDTD